METINAKRQPDCVLLISELDVELIQQLSKHWVVIVEQQNDEFRIELYPKCNE